MGEALVACNLDARSTLVYVVIFWQWISIFDCVWYVVLYFYSLDICKISVLRWCKCKNPIIYIYNLFKKEVHRCTRKQNGDRVNL